jgi:hypothetical protein
MASPIIIRVKCDPYLARFLETLYGGSPVSFPKKSNFNAILDLFLERPDLDYVEPDYGANTLEIRLPYFDHKNILSYYYLSPAKQEIFVNQVWKFFKVTYRAYISRCIVVGLERQEAISIFITKYNISLDSWDLLEKDYQRYLKVRSKNRLLRTNKNLSDRDPFCPAGSAG